MSRYKRGLLINAAYGLCCSRGWTPDTFYRISHQVSVPTARATPLSHAWTTSCRSVFPVPRPRETTAVASSRDPWHPDHDEAEDGKPRPPPRVKMDDNPIPDYLVDMLKEAGEVDEHGKPLNDPWDPDDDDDTFGTKREREKNAEAKDVYNDVPFGEMLFEEDSEVVNSEVGGLMDTSITDAVIEYGFPVEFFLDTLCRWGVTPPISQYCRLGDLIDAEQAAGLCEALTGLDGADVRDNYLDETLEDLAYELEIPLPDLLQACAANKINLPQGGYTHLTIDEYKLLLDNVVEGGERNPVRRLFDESRMSTRWSGQRELESREADRAESDRLIESNNRGFGWKNGPPVVGDREGEIPIGMAHITGRIFAEDAFTSIQEDDYDEDESSFFELDGE